MDEPFFLPVIYKGVEQQFEASLQRRGYVHVLSVNVYGAPVIFERDEEGNWRALISGDEKGKIPDPELFQAIGQTIEDILK
jgi:hypothetical protein